MKIRSRTASGFVTFRFYSKQSFGGKAQQKAMHSIFVIFCIVLTSRIFISAAVKYSNRWAIQIDGDIGEADRLARKHGFVNQGKVRGIKLKCKLNSTERSTLVLLRMLI